MVRSWWNWYIATSILFILTIWFMGTCARAAELICPNVKIENPKHLKWNATDTAGQRTATKGCVKWFSRSPCLIKFIKRDTNAYHAICGAKR